jgi:plastocyanin
MKKLLNPRPLLLAVALLALPLFAAVAFGDSGAKSGGHASKNASVSVRDDAFSPRSASVTVGGKVTWRWRGSNPHNVKFRKVPRGASKRGKGTQTSGRFSRTFSKRGTYRYVCTIHEDIGMRGTVKVG